MKDGRKKQPLPRAVQVHKHESDFVHSGSDPPLQQLRGVAWNTVYCVSHRDLGLDRAPIGQACRNKGQAFERNRRHDGFGSRGLRGILDIFALSCI
jgi:hypothetical protein